MATAAAMRTKYKPSATSHAPQATSIHDEAERDSWRGLMGILLARHPQQHPPFFGMAADFAVAAAAG